MRWLLAFLALLLAGCAGAGDAPPPADDVCARKWDAYVEESERHQFADHARLVLVVSGASGNLSLAIVDHNITWGHDPSDGRTLRGTLDALVDAPPPWTFEDAAEPGVLSDGDRFVVRAEGASSRDLHAMVTLEDADGRFLGGSARCL